MMKDMCWRFNRVRSAVFHKATRASGTFHLYAQVSINSHLFESIASVFVFVVQNVFKTLPNKRISRIELGGKVGSDAASRDRIFASSISHVTGYSKKGKQFFNFETNMTEPIKAMYVFKHTTSKHANCVQLITFTFNIYNFIEQQQQQQQGGRRRQSLH